MVWFQKLFNKRKMPEQGFTLVAGLGNPGVQYADTRHNIGFMVIDHLAEKHAVQLDSDRSGALVGRGRIKTCRVMLVKPLSYMNLSGIALEKLRERYRMSCRDIVVIHDDIDLAFERLKIKMKGGDGGHRGLSSIIDVFGDNDFIRVRMGVGRPQPGQGVVEHVLGAFDKDKKKNLETFITEAGEAVATILCEGAKEGMSRFNRK